MTSRLGQYEQWLACPMYARSVSTDFVDMVAIVDPLVLSRQDSDADRPVLHHPELFRHVP